MSSTALPTARIRENSNGVPGTGVRAGIRQAGWSAGALELLGFAHLTDRPTERPGEARTVLTLRPLTGHRVLRLRTTPYYLPEATDDSGQARLNHDWAGFTARIDPRVLRRRRRWEDGVWRVDATVLAGVHRAEAALAPHWCGSGEYPPAGWTEDGVQLVPYFADGALHLLVRTAGVLVTRLRAAGGGFELRGLSRTDPAGSVLRLRHRQSPAVLELLPRVGGREFAVLAPPPPGGPGEQHWEPELAYPDGRCEPLLTRLRPPAEQLQLPLPDGRTLYAKRLPDDRLQLCAQPALAVVDAVTAADGGFALAGALPLPGDGPLEQVLRHGGDGRIHTGPAERQPDGRFTARLPLAPPASDGLPRPLGKGVWELGLRPAGRPAEERTLLLAPGVLAALPARARAGRKTFLLQRRWHDTLVLDSTPVLAAPERSAHRQRRLRTESYPAARRRPLREAVLYDVFGGRDYACSPRAVHAELARRAAALEHLWAVEDDQARLPAGVTPVRLWSPEWYEALARCRYLVGNTHFPDFLRRRDGQVVVQLWHGTPLKRIGYEARGRWLAEDGYLDRLAREVRQWSLLLSPSPFATPVLRRAFDYRGEVLETGYPRNDLLARPDPAAADAVRRRLGIPEGHRVVLYAPTWRDDQRHGDRYRLDLRLDLAAARRELGRDHVLLVRPHVHVGGSLPADGFVRDVADYPDVQELLLAADVLVTDYSSLMFDFAVTGRPMLFFTYDLAHYRDELRGFTFDFEHDAPGPLLATSEQLIAALRAPDAGHTAHRDRYLSFRRRFCPLDDGAATARLVDRMLTLGTGQEPPKG